ncbi:MAG TPA: pyruvate kinase [Candidatus Limiplasma sp.]|nr:pyruvate kinase [Candidatus Limiplasma sp.]HPR78143.1 pyruvate kinase [Candidatus Limiplasma sp.]
MRYRKTKIVCTLGPATESDDVLREMMRSGMDVARLNFSHGTHETHGKTMARVKKLREELGLPIAIMLDTKGPEIRLGNFAKGKVSLKRGQTFVLCTETVAGDEKHATVTYKDLPRDVKEGTVILLDDGLISLTVLSLTDQEITCRVENDGDISDHKGVNVPGAQLSMPFLSEQDKADILFGIEKDIDFVAASFTRCAADILDIRKLFSSNGGKDIGIIAKIENHQGVKNIDEILRVSDGVMVARGDLGVEIPLEEVPVLQKMLIRKAYSSGKQVITATQMLESMITNPRPTRAEATDVANAIYDGTSATMLSGETAAGQYPVEALRTMARIAFRAEADINYVKRFKERENEHTPDVTNAISHATVTSAHDLGAAAIITVTKSGRTARMISKYRPDCPIICCTMEDSVCRRLNLSWGVIPLKIEEIHNTDDLFERAVRAGEEAGLLHNGELVVMTAGVPLSISGTTNLMKVHVVGHILVTGHGVSHRKVRASLCVCESEADAEKNFNDGDILVIHQTTNRLLPQVRKAAGLVLEDGDPNGHGSIAGMSLDIPVIIGAENATRILKTGAVVMLDAERGVVTCDSCTE